LNFVYNTALLADAEKSADKIMRAQITATKLSHTLVLTSPREREIKIISEPISISSSEIPNPNSINRNAHITSQSQVKDVTSEQISIPTSEVSNSTSVNRHELPQQEVKNITSEPTSIPTSEVSNSINIDRHELPQQEVKNTTSESTFVPTSEVSNSININRQQEVKKLTFKPLLIRYFKKYL
jgi:hypothetical protein